MTEPAKFTCPFCGAVSHNPNDIAERYCGRCHVFVDLVFDAARIAALLAERKEKK